MGVGCDEADVEYEQDGQPRPDAKPDPPADRRQSRVQGGGDLVHLEHGCDLTGLIHHRYGELPDMAEGELGDMFGARHLGVPGPGNSAECLHQVIGERKRLANDLGEVRVDNGPTGIPHLDPNDVDLDETFLDGFVQRLQIRHRSIGVLITSCPARSRTAFDTVSMWASRRLRSTAAGMPTPSSTAKTSDSARPSIATLPMPPSTSHCVRTTAHPHPD